MGWGSATGIFDAMVDVGLELYTIMWKGEHSPENIAYVVSKVYPIFEHSDWDTQDESKYFEPHLKNVMLRNGEIDEE